MMKNEKGLMSQKKFYPIFWTQFMGVFAENFFKSALVILVTFKSASVFGLPYSEIVPIANGLLIFPFFLFSATAGQLADKSEKSALIRRLKLIDIVILGLAAAFVLAQNYEALLVMVFIKGVQAAFFSPLKFSILPQHLEPSEMVKGNAYINAGAFLAILVGSILGGLLIVKPYGDWMVVAVMMGFAIVGYMYSRAIPVAEAVAPSLKISPNIVKATWNAMGYARETKSMFIGVMGIAWFWFIAAGYFSIFPLVCRDFFKGDENLVTVMLAIFSVGTAIGSVLCERLSKGRIESGLVPIGTIGITVSGLLLAWLCAAHQPPEGAQGTLDFVFSGSGAAILACLFVLPLFGGFFIVPLYALIQTEGDPRNTSQVIGASNMMNALFMVLAAAFLIVMIRAQLTFAQMFVVLSVLNVVAGACMYLFEPEFLKQMKNWIAGRPNAEKPVTKKEAS